MKVLFIGEYSGVFTELSKSLEQKGVSVFKVSNGDGYKNFPTDILFRINYSKKRGFIRKLLWAIGTYLGLSGFIDFLYKWHKYKRKFGGYDVVQLVNPVALSGYGSIANIIMVRYVVKHNKRLFLSVMGDDYYVTRYMKNNHERGNEFYNQISLKDVYTAKYLWGLGYKWLNKYVVNHCDRIMPILIDYLEPYQFSPKVTHKILPIPLSETFLGESLRIKDNHPIIIFHGWQLGKEKRKGNDVYDRVIRRVVDKYKGKVEYVVVHNVPFDEYIELFKKSHIFIDQLYVRDKGVNGLLGMAAGKVVFSGLQSQALRSYPNYNDEVVGISASVDENELFSRFCELIDNPRLIERISANAIEFVRSNHLSSLVADMYLEIWKDKI